MKFDNKISIDGIAVIVATIGVIIWLSRLGATVENHTIELADHQQQIQKADDTLGALQQNIAVLTVLQQKQKP